MKTIVAALTFLFLFSSCAEERKDAVISNSPDGNIKLSVSGKRSTTLDPWTADLVAEGSGIKGNISFEFYGKDINNETVKFEWEGNDKCTVTFIQRDDTKRVFEFTPSSNTGMWRDVSEK